MKTTRPLSRSQTQYDTIVALARPEDRAGLISAIFTVGYFAFSIPVVIAGVAASHYGLHTTALVYYPVVAVLAATAAGSFLIRRARRPSRADANMARTSDVGAPEDESTRLSHPHHREAHDDHLR